MKATYIFALIGLSWTGWWGTACSEKTLDVPTHYTEVQEPVSIYPDYKGVVVPPNIAPLNFLVRSPGRDYVAVLGNGKEELVVSAQASQTIQFDEAAWHRLLDAHQGDSLQMTIYSRLSTGWVRYPAYSFYRKNGFDPLEKSVTLCKKIKDEEESA